VAVGCFGAFLRAFFCWWGVGVAEPADSLYGAVMRFKREIGGRLIAPQVDTSRGGL
jgi:hypothetical protein